MAMNEDFLAELLESEPEPPQRVREYERKPRRASKPRQRSHSPLDRRVLDRAIPYALLVLAALAFGLSAVSTVAQTQFILSVGGLHLPIGSRIAIGLLVLLVISGGEVLASESRWYIAFLVPDVALMVWWCYPALERWCVALGVAPTIGIISMTIIAVGIAYLPERVVFGRRR